MIGLEVIAFEFDGINMTDVRFRENGGGIQMDVNGDMILYEALRGFMEKKGLKVSIGGLGSGSGNFYTYNNKEELIPYLTEFAKTKKDWIALVQKDHAAQLQSMRSSAR